MPWVWVAVGLVLWIIAAFAVIALCTSVGQIDRRLGRDREGPRAAPEPEPRASAGVEVE
jgi:hypothetical protein